MALKINVLLLTTDLETIYQAPAGIEASVHGLVFSNNTANTETFNLIFYENSTNSAFHLAEDFEISPKTVYTWPVPINMEPGDYLESSSSSNDAITVSASYFEGGKKIAKGFTPRGIWDENASYDINDIVIFEGEVFAATEETTGIDPTESNSGWILFIPQGDFSSNNSNVQPVEYYEVVIPSSAWVDNGFGVPSTAEITVNGIKEEDRPHLYLDFSKISDPGDINDKVQTYNLIYRIETISNDSLKFYAERELDDDLDVVVKVI